MNPARVIEAQTAAAAAAAAAVGAARLEPAEGAPVVKEAVAAAVKAKANPNPSLPT